MVGELEQYNTINSYTCITKSKIGYFCSVGSNVSIGQCQHPYSKLSTNTYFIEEPYKAFTKKECTIKNDVWIGSYAMIMRGVIVGNGAVIGGIAL